MIIGCNFYSYSLSIDNDLGDISSDSCTRAQWVQKHEQRRSLKKVPYSSKKYITVTSEYYTRAVNSYSDKRLSPIAGQSPWKQENLLSNAQAFFPAANSYKTNCGFVFSHVFYQLYIHDMQQNTHQWYQHKRNGQTSIALCHYVAWHNQINKISESFQDVANRHNHIDPMNKPSHTHTHMCQQ